MSFVCLHVAHGDVVPGSLVAVAREFSARVEAHDGRLVVFDASGLTRLFGDARAIGLEVGRAAMRRGLTPRVVVAGTRVAAMLVAHARPGLTVVAPGNETAAVAGLPVVALEALADLAWPNGLSSGERASRRRAGRRRRAGSGRHYRLAPGPEVDAGARFTTPVLSAHVETLTRWGIGTLGEL
ncbi:MAG TPA: hypothetical protein VJK49_05805, partial [Candidatus Limnocylindrales bacterium]|nr:hypothetical protein [Candidatus Limnocylindrales bacterium]